MKSSLHLISKNLIYNGTYLFEKSDETGEYTVIPAVGDIILLPSKERTLVAISDIVEEDEGLYLEVYTLDNRMEVVVNRKGRRKKFLVIADESSDWPMENIELFRDGKKIYPVNLKFNIINSYFLLLKNLKERAGLAKERGRALLAKAKGKVILAKEKLVLLLEKIPDKIKNIMSIFKQTK
jgi:hypothetical protein